MSTELMRLVREAHDGGEERFTTATAMLKRLHAGELPDDNTATIGAAIEAVYGPIAHDEDTLPDVGADAYEVPKARRKGRNQADIAAAMRDGLAGFGTNVLDTGIYVTGPLPWDALGIRRRWTDADSEHLFCWCQKVTGAKSRRNVQGAFTIVAAERRFNPLADMLDSLPPWDGTRRADCLLWVLVGCEDTPYTRAVSHTFMRGAVVRAYRPGCKFDSCLTLIGPQGCGKSLAVRRMCMQEAFLCESVTDLTDHRLTAEQTMCKWFAELAELEGMTGRRLTGVKQALTMQSATVRLAYARNPVDLPRSCVFVATTNEGEFLADPTGARRFWPVRCAVVADRKGWEVANDLEVDTYVSQAWAEVVSEYRAATKLPPERFAAAFPTRLDAEAERAANEARETASMEDTDVGAVLEWLRGAVERDGITRVCTRMVAERALGIDMSRERGRRTATANVARILNDHASEWRFVGKQRVDGYGIVRAWDYTGS